LTKIGVNVEICLGNNRDNFQLQRFATGENIAKSFRGGGYWYWLTLYVQSPCTYSFCLRRFKFVVFKSTDI